MKEKKVRTTQIDFLFTKGPKGPKGQHKRVSGSISKINGRLRSHLSYQNLTLRQLARLEERFDEMALYVIEHGEPFLQDQYSLIWNLNKECNIFYLMRVEWIR